MKDAKRRGALTVTWESRIFAYLDTPTPGTEDAPNGQCQVDGGNRTQYIQRLCTYTKSIFIENNFDKSAVMHCLEQLIFATGRLREKRVYLERL